MRPGVTSVTKGNQILFGIITRVAAELIVVNFQIPHRATRLAPPVVATENLLSQYFE
jgi:hypothetical protein